MKSPCRPVQGGRSGTPSNARRARSTWSVHRAAGSRTFAHLWGLIDYEGIAYAVFARNRSSGSAAGSRRNRADRARDDRGHGAQTERVAAGRADGRLGRHGRAAPGGGHSRRRGSDDRRAFAGRHLELESIQHQLSHPAHRQRGQHPGLRAGHRPVHRWRLSLALRTGPRRSRRHRADRSAARAAVDAAGPQRHGRCDQRQDGAAEPDLRRDGRAHRGQRRAHGRCAVT